LARRQRRILRREQLVDRTEDEGERSAELVADVADEVGLGAVDLGEPFGTLLRALVGACIGDGGADRPG
jgi:hypothetical protein